MEHKRCHQRRLPRKANSLKKDWRSEGKREKLWNIFNRCLGWSCKTEVLGFRVRFAGCGLRDGGQKWSESGRERGWKFQVILEAHFWFLELMISRFFFRSEKKVKVSAQSGPQAESGFNLKKTVLHETRAIWTIYSHCWYSSLKFFSSIMRQPKRLSIFGNLKYSNNKHTSPNPRLDCFDTPPLAGTYHMSSYYVRLHVKSLVIAGKLRCRAAFAFGTLPRRTYLRKSMSK